MKNLFNASKSIKLFRSFSSLPPISMKSWQLNKYGGELSLVKKEPLPLISRPNDVLIEVKAASINPIDCMISKGYVSKLLKCKQNMDCLLNINACNDSLLNPPREFPMVLGRDFSGKVVNTGTNVNKMNFKKGDEVWGTLTFWQSGSFSQYISVPVEQISLKPPSLSHNEAASFPYVSSTVFSCLSSLPSSFSSISLSFLSSSCSSFSLSSSSSLLWDDRLEEIFENKKVLILGGSGGVGTYAIQLLSSLGAEVTTTVGEGFLDQASELGADNVVDYRKPDAFYLLNNHGKYDFILDTLNINQVEDKFTLSPSFLSSTSSSFSYHPSRQELLSLLKTNLSSQYVTIVTPLVHNINNNGFFSGSILSSFQFAQEFIQGLSHGSVVKWSLFRPDIRALAFAATLIENKKMKPVIERIYSFNEIPLALQKVGLGSSKGKIVIDFNL